MSDPTKELIFQSDVIARMAASGWKRGAVGDYDRDRALYPAIINCASFSGSVSIG